MKFAPHLSLYSGKVGEFAILPGDPERCILIADHLENPQLVSSNREFVTYTGKYRELTVSVVSTGMGCPSAAIALEELVMLGTKAFVRLGTTGALQKNLKIGELVIAHSAVRTDGTSLEYIAPEFPAIADLDLTIFLEEAAKGKGVNPWVGTIWSHDAFYKGSVFADPEFLNREKWMIEANVLSVENESTALFVISSIRKVKTGTILTVVANHHTREVISNEENLRPIFDLMTEICLDAFYRLRISGKV
ncbi:MAG: nucleoside phosphorylase [Caldiserica bacterium]|jgi:uridine phosphorylase|nr:nucleoside phosphorylase [Caldisericota bacterium]MDH7562845.1 nucleoside phosphorylase [Caldisericota bacterium]